MPHDPVLTLLIEMLHTAARFEVEREALRAAGAGNYQLTDHQLRAERVDLGTQETLEMAEAPDALPEDNTIVLHFS